MGQAKNVLDLFVRLEAMRAQHPTFDPGLKLTDPEKQFLVDLTTAINKLLPQIPDSMLVFDAQQAAQVNHLLKQIEQCFVTGNGQQLNLICAVLANDFEVEMPKSDPDVKLDVSDAEADHDPDCIGEYVNFLWWVSLVCVPKIQCIVKHAAADVVRDRLYLGICDNQGTETCKCFPTHFRLSTILLLISIALLFVAGPLGAAGRETVRQLILRLAPTP